MKFILGSYEFVSVVHRRILERVFGVPVFNLYGSTETGHLLMENECGEMKPGLETAFLENVEPDERGVGHLVVTTLTNDYMPLVRYRIGDLVERQERPYGDELFCPRTFERRVVPPGWPAGDDPGGGPMFCRRWRHCALFAPADR